MVEYTFSESNMTIHEMEDEKWEAMRENSLESAIYALYLQSCIDEIMVDAAKRIIEQFKDGGD